jgi:hypothetical protein
MFIWCDATIALISREQPVIPVSYLEAIIQHGPEDGWDFFSLAGCQEGFVFAMMKLASLAAQIGNGQGIDESSHDTVAVDDIEKSLQEVPNDPPCEKYTEHFNDTENYPATCFSCCCRYLRRGEQSLRERSPQVVGTN